MSVSAALHTQLAAVMESLVHAAVAELKKLMEGSSLLLLGLDLQSRCPREEPHLRDKLQADSGETMVSMGGVRTRVSGWFTVSTGASRD